MTQNPHAPNRFGSYYEIHQTVLEQFKAREFIQRDSLEFLSLNGQIRLHGEISCLGKILILVDKYLDIVAPAEARKYLKQSSPIDNTWLVQTVEYSYNVSIQGIGNIFRYDNQDDYWLDEYDHPDNHHKHIFDWEKKR